MRFLTTDAERRVLLNPELALGEVYMDGSFVVEQGIDRRRAGDPAGSARNIAALGQAAMVAALSGQACPAVQSARPRRRDNVAHHYDLDGRLYSLFLDADKQYSCAYFETPDATLDDAQLAKKRHLAAKLLIERGDRVLDIGSGWGGLGLYLAEMTGANVTGVTLSTEQLQVSNARAAEKNLARSAQVSARGLSRRSRPVRPHRVGRHVRACRRRLLRDLFQALRRTLDRRRRHGAAFDRPLGRAPTSPIPGLRNTFSRAAISRRSPR